MRQAGPQNVDWGLGLKAEHICLESGEAAVVERTVPACAGPTFRFVTSRRGGETELTFSADHRLAVRVRRANRPGRRYVLDLRFVDAATVARRGIAWRGWHALVALFRTRVTVALCSVHGAARLAQFTGRPGAAGDAATFVAELARRVETARTRAPQTKQQFLRDEMREHHRLWQEGLLSDTVYEEAKRRILRAHD